MEVIYLLIPVSLVLIGAIAWIFIWAIRSGQFDDLEGPAHRILMDDDDGIEEVNHEQHKARGDKQADTAGSGRK